LGWISLTGIITRPVCGDFEAAAVSAYVSVATIELASTNFPSTLTGSPISALNPRPSFFGRLSTAMGDLSLASATFGDPAMRRSTNPAINAAVPHIEVIARALIRRGQEILVCRNTKHGYFYLPGGHVEFGEPAAAALARELREETGLELQVGGCLLGSEVVFEAGSKLHHELNLVFHGELSDRMADVRSLEDGIRFQWMDEASVIDQDLRPPSIKAWLAAGGATESTCGWASEVIRRPKHH
jgi:ADP-ribose pyrophosphatase YjhB (NUDIX family)